MRDKRKCHDFLLHCNTGDKESKYAPKEQSCTGDHGSLDKWQKEKDTDSHLDFNYHFFSINLRSSEQVHQTIIVLSCYWDYSFGLGYRGDE